MNRKFDFELPENIKNIPGAKDYIEGLLTQHKDFVANGFKDHIKPDELDSRVKEAIEKDSTDRTAKRNSLKERIKKVLPTGLVDKDGEQYTTLALRSLDFSKEYTDDELSGTLKKFNEDKKNKNLFESSYNDFFSAKIVEQKAEPTEEEIDKEIADDERLANL